MRRCLARLLLEHMQHVHCFIEGGNVEDAMSQFSLNPDLADALSHARHRLPIVGIEPLLHLSQLESAATACIGRERADITLCAPEPGEWLIRRNELYKLLYIVSTRSLLLCARCFVVRVHESVFMSTKYLSLVELVA